MIEVATLTTTTTQKRSLVHNNVSKSAGENNNTRRRTIKKITPLSSSSQSSASERVKYLRCLGIESSVTKNATKEAERTKNNNSDVSMLGGAHSFTEPLKYEGQYEGDGVESSSSSTTTRKFSWSSLFNSNTNNNDDSNGNESMAIVEEDEDGPLSSPASLSTSLSSSSSDDDGSLLALDKKSCDDDDYDDNDEKDKKNKSKSLTFNSTVHVMPIPKRDEYSNRIKEKLYTNSNELNINAYRNSIEFASEGWDWNNVIEDDDMYVCNISGEKIHPVHIAVDTDNNDN